MNVDIEVEPGLTANAGTQQPVGAAPRQHRLQRRQQVPVLAAQVDKTLASSEKFVGSFRHG